MSDLAQFLRGAHDHYRGMGLTEEDLWELIAHDVEAEGWKKGTQPTGRTSRGNSPETSKAAADRIKLTAGSLRWEVLRHVVLFSSILDNGVTHLDLQKRFHQKRPSTVRTRVSELVKLGLVKDSGDTSHQEGSERILWIATDEGRARIEAGR